MPEFYSPWQDAGNATQEIGNSLRRLTLTLATRQAMQRYQQQRIALAQAALQQRAAVEQAQAGLYNAEMQHHQRVDQAAREQSAAVGSRAFDSGNFQGGPSIQNAQQMALARELAARAMVRGLGGNVDNPPTGIVGPGQERINTLTGDVLGYLPPNPTFHSVPAGATPYTLDQGQAMQAGPQTGFRPQQPRMGIPTFHPGTQYSAPVIFDPNQRMVIPYDEGTSNAPAHFGQPMQYGTNELGNAVRAGADTTTKKKPTRAQAAQYVKDAGGNVESAIQALQNDGFDTSGYAD